MPHGKIYQDVTETVGNTPLIRLNRLGQGLPGRIAVKHEGYNPYDSVKDRIGAAMINDAVEKGRLRPGMFIVEPTSGNTGIGLAYVAAARGYRCIFTMPETMTLERRQPAARAGLQGGAHRGAQGHEGRHRAGRGDPGPPGRPRLDAAPVRQSRQSRHPLPHHRPGDLGRHRGQGGHLRRRASAPAARSPARAATSASGSPGIHIVAVEPAESPVLSGGQPSPHRQQGIGAGFIPGLLDTKIYDEVVRVSNDDAIATARRLAREEAIFAGISSGSITWAALQVAARPENAGKLIVSIVCDFGERYLSNPVYTELPDPDFSDIEDALAAPAGVA